MVVSLTGISEPFPAELQNRLLREGFRLRVFEWAEALDERSSQPMCVWLKKDDINVLKRDQLVCWSSGSVLLVLDDDSPEFMQAAWRVYPADVIPPAEHDDLGERLKHLDQPSLRRSIDDWQRKALPLAHAGIWAYSIQTGKMRSHGFWRLLGEDVELNGVTLEEWLERVADEHKALVRQQVLALQKGLIDHAEITCKTFSKLGGAVWLHSRIELKKNEKGDPFALVGVTLDVTEYKTAEERLHENQTRYRHLFHTLRSGVFVIESVGDEPNFIVKDCNRAAAKLHKRTPQSLVGSEFSVGGTEITDEGVVEACREVWRSNLPQRYVYKLMVQGRLYNEIEHYIYKLPNNELVVVFDDITRQKQAEYDLEHQLHFMQELVDAIPNPVFYKDVQRLYRFCNQAFVQVIGKPREEILDHGVFDVYAPEEAVKLYEQNSRVIERNERIQFELVRVVGGEERVYLSHEAPYVNKHGQMMGLVGSLVDITEQKRVEHLKLEQEKLAERSLRLASLGTLAGGLAHEINQPLTVIKAEVDGVRIRKELMQDIPIEELLETLEVIGGEVTRIHEIVDHMRSLIRGRPGDSEQRIDLNEVVLRGLRIISQQVSNHGIELQFDLDEQSPEVRGYPINLEQILINLVANAMQALDSVEQEQKRILVSTVRRDGRVIVAIADNGPGIPEESLSHVFDPFFTTKYDLKGFGLGLAIVENYAQLMDGQVAVANRPEGGAVFSVSLPLLDLVATTDGDEI